MNHFMIHIQDEHVFIVFVIKFMRNLNLYQYVSFTRPSSVDRVIIAMGMTIRPQSKRKWED